MLNAWGPTVFALLSAGSSTLRIIIGLDLILRNARTTELLTQFYYIQIVWKPDGDLQNAPRITKKQYACALRASVLPIYSPLGNSEILSWLICLRPAISRYSVRVCPAHHGDANSMSRPPDRMRTTPGKCWRRSKDLKAPREKAQMDRINNWLYLSLNAINNLYTI